MAGAKIVVLYPRPIDPEAFEQVYDAEHVPMVLKNFPQMTTFTTTKVLGSPQGDPPYSWVAELHFQSLDVLQASAATEEARQTVAHGMALSTGGSLTLLVCVEARTIPVWHEIRLSFLTAVYKDA